MRSSHLVIGEITKPQGVRGEIKLRPLTCDPDRFDGLETVYMKRGDAYEPVHIKVNRIGDDAVFFNMEGITDRNQVEKLRGELLYIDREHAVELDEDTEFLCDLYGLHGWVNDGRDLGILKDVLQPGGNDVYVFNGPMGEVLVPALKDVVEGIDYDAETIRFIAKRFDEVAVTDEN